MCAGAIRRESGSEGTVKEKEKDKEADAQEELNYELNILMRAIRDMNNPKLVQEDLFLFNNLFNDLFPNEGLPESSNQQLMDAIENELKNL